MIAPDQIQSAYGRIQPHIRRTPTIEVDSSDFGVSAGLLILKLELLQHAGSFKSRGAFNNLLTRKVPSAGVVSSSHELIVPVSCLLWSVTMSCHVPAVLWPSKAESGCTGFATPEYHGAWPAQKPLGRTCSHRRT